MDVSVLINWFLRVEGNPYSIVRELFSIVDHPTEAFPPPFNSESMAVNIRLFKDLHLGDKAMLEELTEALRNRYMEVSGKSNVQTTLQTP